MKEKTKESIIQKIHSTAIKKTAEVLTLSTLLFLPMELKATTQSISRTTETEYTQSNKITFVGETLSLLPTMEEAYNRLSALDSTTPLPKQINRLALPKNNESIKINFTFQATPAQQNLFNQAISEFNDIFAVINPAYFFEANYSPSKSDLTNIYNISVKGVETFEDKNMLGLATSICKDLTNEIDGKELYSHQIEIKESILTDSNKLLTVFKHEIMHLLGAEDDYSQSNTIMRQLDTNNITHLSSADINFLNSLYYKENNTYSQNDIKNFADTYEMNNAFMWSKRQQEHYQEFCLDALKTHFNALTEEELLKQISITFSEKYTDFEINEFTHNLLAHSEKTDNFNLTNFGELLQQDQNTSIHKFIQTSENSIIAHNYRDIDCSQKMQLYHFERTLNNLTKYENFLGNEKTAYITINNYVLQVDYDINEDGKVNFTPTNLYKQLNYSKEEYVETLTSNQDNITSLCTENFQLAK
ncbi:MAG: hypothetical protein J6J24_04870 [Clostridia bacterium]|nr:hypothetical protein [Clostridia bacterium]